MKRRTDGASVIDVGCGWGRWTFAAVAAGWDAVALDPWLDNCKALHRVALQLGLRDRVTIVHGDGRKLPLESGSVDAAFSYSVLQHLPKSEAEATLSEMIRVVRPGGSVRVQMPNVAGVRQRIQRRRGLINDSGFNVRPWTFPELVKLAQGTNSPWSISADGFFSLNAQWTERRSMPYRSKMIVGASELLRRTSALIPALVKWADSVWLDFEVT